ncbi:MAG TPA: archaemetzincin [Polyangia bacterium]
MGRSGLAASLVALATALAACGDKQPAGPPRAQTRSAHAVLGTSPAPVPRAAFDADPALFPRKRPPGFLDWSAVHHEADQSFQEYVEDAPTRPSATRRTIVLQPIGPFSPAENELLDTLSDYLGIYFQMETRVAEPIPLPTLGMRTRDEDGRLWVQYRTDILIYQLLQPRLPKDAVVYLGITTADLFPEPAWNFVFGVGNMDKRLGVYSLARLGPGFYGDPDTPETRARTLRRALAVLAHETGHVFSLRHCRAFECLMNGANSIDELDRGTPWLCPDCLRKLHFNTGFDIRKHYDELRAFYSTRQMHEPTDWLDRRLGSIGR